MSQPGRDFYNILGISRDATESQIKKAYRKLVLKHHPDKVPKAQWNDKMAKIWHNIQDAYNALSDPQKRDMYDQFGEEGLNSAGGANPFGGFGDILSHLFGRGQSRQANQNKKPQPVVREHGITLEEAFMGCTKPIRVKLKKRCPKCDGFGCQNPEQNIKVCGTCGGKGVRMVRQQIGPGFVAQTQIACNACNATGKLVNRTATCTMCKGQCRLDTVDEIQLQIPRGIRDGEAIVFEGKGNHNTNAKIGTDEPGGSGDLVFAIRVKPHPIYKRVHNQDRKDDLVVEKQILLHQALCGCDIDLPFLDGTVFTDHIDHVIDPYTVKTYMGKGMPSRHDPSVFGKLMIKFKVVFPKNLSETTKKNLKKLLL